VEKRPTLKKKGKEKGEGKNRCSSTYFVVNHNFKNPYVESWNAERKGDGKWREGRKRKKHKRVVGLVNKGQPIFTPSCELQHEISLGRGE